MAVLQFYKAGLAYEATGLINWCPKDKTGLANEEVIDGRCERCGTIVEKKELRQWYLKITAYAEKLLEGLKHLPQWPEAVKLQQENWIGKSEGAEIEFSITEPGEKNQKHGAISYIMGVENIDSDLKTLGVTVVEKTSDGDYKVVIPESKVSDYEALILKKIKPGFWNEYIFNDIVFLFKNKKGMVYKLTLNASTELTIIDLCNRFSNNTFTNVREMLEGNSYYKGKLPYEKIKVFTTRPDTIFGATYLVLAPEHSIISNDRLSISNIEEVNKYVEKTKEKTEIDRTSESKEKTGVELKGIKVINPATKQEIPIFVADYVLGLYGTGAIMAVPAHDQRDFEFAKKFNLEIKKVVSPEGILFDSGIFDGLNSEQAIPKVAASFGKLTTQYRLHDWVFSRQRYWGEPIPIINCQKCGTVPVPEKDLPLKLPFVKNYEPTGTGESPLAAIAKWVNVKCPNCKGPAKRETNTMPNWAGSSWYYLRYTDPRDKKSFADLKKQKYWTPVDVYFGGMEHTTLHLLYSRFWNLFLHDQKLVTAKEPYTMRKPHGIVLGPDGEKMSKSRGNVVNPDDGVKTFGADTVRMYELFLGPHEAMVSWSDQGIVGVYRFLDRVWNWGNSQNGGKDSEKTQRAINKLIKKVTEDIENFRFNTSVSAFMEFYNAVKEEPISKESFKKFLAVLYPFAPHLTEELHQMLGGKKSLQLEKWPKFDESKLAESTVEIIIQVNGKVRGKITVMADSKEDAVKTEALKNEGVTRALAGNEIKRLVFVPNKLINLVV